VSDLSINLPPELVEAIAQRAAELALAQLSDDAGHSSNGTSSPYLTIPEAAELLRAKRHRIDDLLSRGTLTRVKDGSRTLISRDELNSYLRGEPTGRRR
jgi:excisionase family DNA binding protein